jgi:hypothetical protein
MKKLVEWGVKMPVSGRTYHRGSILMPEIEMDIKVLCTHYNNHKIGKCKLFENEIGLFATDIEYSINTEKLNEIQESNISHLVEEGKLDPENDLFTKELTIGVFGKADDEYFDKNSVELRFLYHDLFLAQTKSVYNRDNGYNINDIVRELKLDYILNEN